MTSYFSKAVPLIGPVSIAESGGNITMLLFGEQAPWPSAKNSMTPLLADAFEQMDAYLSGDLTDFDIPLLPVGTPFRKRVWQALMDIPYGTTASYADIAAAIEKPKACRAVGAANHANPIPIFIPCHRVIGKDGSLTGYGGGLAVKRRLIELERTHGRGMAR